MVDGRGDEHTAIIHTVTISERSCYIKMGGVAYPSSPPPPLIPCTYIRKTKMDYIERLDRMDEHLRQHPHDYQTVIARLKLASDIYDHQVEKQRNMRLKRLSEIKKRLREEDIAHGKESE